MNFLQKLYDMRDKKKADNKGFSLVELIIVIAIMAILVGIVGTQVIPYINKSKEAKDFQIINSYSTAATTAYSSNAEKIMGNEVVKRALHHAQEEVEVGTPLSVPLEESGVFPPMVYHMISIGEETGNMEAMLDKIADYYEEEVEMATQSLLAVLEPLIIIMMAVIVVPIILAIMMPMFSLYDQLGA